VTTEQDFRDRYRSLALDWAAAHDDPKKANRIFKTHHAFYKEIRNQEIGRLAIESLLDDPEPAVRVLAATHALPFSPAHGEHVLEELQRGSGVFAIDAKYTLISFRTGTLDLDW
jgi:hypothetical protein